MVGGVQPDYVQERSWLFLQQEGSCSYDIAVIKTKESIKREAVLRTPTINVVDFWSSLEAGSDETIFSFTCPTDPLKSRFRGWHHDKGLIRIYLE